MNIDTNQRPTSLRFSLVRRQQEFLTSCTDELSSCAGHDVVKEYVVSARPHQCQDTSAAPRGLAALSLLLGSLLLHLGLSNSL